MAHWWHDLMVRLTLWMVRRYVTTELSFHHSIVTQTWYPYVVQQVRKQASSDLDGPQKRLAIVEAATARFHAHGLTVPPLVDLHLAIEYAVRDHTH